MIDIGADVSFCLHGLYARFSGVFVLPWLMKDIQDDGAWVLIFFYDFEFFGDGILILLIERQKRV